MRGWRAVLAGLAMVGCRSQDPEAYEPPTFPPPPPKEVRVHEPSGAILSLPEPAWAWLDAAGLAEREPDAVLGFRRDARCEGWVAVTGKVESSPRPAAARALEARSVGRTWDVHVDEDVLYAAHTARRWEIQGRDGDTIASERTSFLIEGPRLFALHARARDSDYARRRRCLDAVTAAFDVMPWEPPEVPGAAPDAGPVVTPSDAGP